VRICCCGVKKYSDDVCPKCGWTRRELEDEELDEKDIILW